MNMEQFGAIENMKKKTVITIAGSDSSGGAGIQADIKTIESKGVFAMSVITALTAQNTMGITGVLPVPKDFIYKQLEAVLEDIRPDAVKIGMLPNKEAMEAVVLAIDKYDLKNVVIDPVLSSTSGTELSRKDATEYMMKELFSRSILVTPNIPEAEILCGIEISSEQDMEVAAKTLGDACGCNVLLKGGHSTFEANGVTADLLYMTNLENADAEAYIVKDEDAGRATDENAYIDDDVRWISGTRIDNPNTHGTGCTLSSAIAANLAKGYDLETAVRSAKEYMEKCIAADLDLGHGRGPLWHYCGKC
ncbi:hydroxymethylpyrimidine/phosphomethylpyrimidine kinase [Butyrivibrio sp. ob235]|nr:hydroxymethylpyrimidine/phosphomethylpyrimidine kinase [Butyrivibrio sp. ob235]